MISYLTRHMQVMFATIGNIARTPLSSLNIIIIVAITLLLPSLFYIVIKTTHSLSSSWQGRPQVSIFLNKELNEQEAKLIFEEITLHPTIALAEYISPQQALDEFKRISELDKEIDFLGENPLPASVVVMPDEGHASPEKLLELKQQLSKIDGIEQIRLDLDWTKKFNAIIGVLSKIVAVLSCLFAIGLIFIIGNTIKLIILNRRAEIEITKLVGGTNAFIRRPFLYYGMLIGILGAIVSIMMAVGIRILMSNSLDKLTAVYQSNVLLYQPKALEILILISVGGLIGWLASRFSVAQHLRNIEPQ